MISINATIIIQVMHFLILAFILNRLMFRPILKLIKERAGHMEKAKDETRDCEEETERLRNEYISQEDEARKQADKERLQIRAEGITETEEILSDSRKRVMTIRTKAEEKANKEVKETKPLLQKEVKTLADVIFEKLIGRRISD